MFLSALQGVLTQVTQTTKQTLNRLGVFTVSSFHAYICARRSVTAMMIACSYRVTLLVDENLPLTQFDSPGSWCAATAKAG